VNVIDDPKAPDATSRAIGVGRDAYGIALNTGAGKLYVSNWADETNPGRTTGDPETATGTVSVVDVSSPSSETETQRVAVGRHPTGVALASDGSTLFVANSADDTISKLSLDGSGLVTGVSTISVKPQATTPKAATPISVAFSADGAFVFVALAGANAVEVLTAAGAPMPRTVRIGPTELAIPHTYIPTGWYPVAMATASALPGSTSTRLYVANLKGIGSGPGYNAQVAVGVRSQGTISAIEIPADPAARDAAFDQWTATVVENNRWAAMFQLASDPASNPCVPAPLAGGGTTHSQLLCDAWNGDVDPRELHVVYVIKENKTFDQFFGDLKPTLPGADADPAYLLYGEAVTTNQHNLARQFTISDDFWADSEQSTTGHQWTSAGYATEHDEITWNQEYDQGLRGNRGGGQYDGQFTGESDDDVARQEREINEPEERLVDLLADETINTRGLGFRVYSNDVNEGAASESGRVPLGMWGIGPSTPHDGGDLEFPDTDRVKLFLDGHVVSNAWTFPGPPPPSFGKEIGFCGAPDDPALDNGPQSFCSHPDAALGDYEKFSLRAWTAGYETCVAGGGSDALCQRAMPNFIYMTLPNDHTLGFNPYAPAPASMVADNDYATGLLVEGLSQSPFWKNTIVFVTEDDTQLSGDHVDSHRTFLITTGGLAERHGPAGNASHQRGSFPAVLKTVEVLLGLPALTIYDQNAVPLHDLVVDALPATAPGFTAVRPPTPFLRNPPDGPLADLSLQVSWTVDQADPCVVTGMMYAGLRGWPLPECARRLLD
jgi:hypothetical protein